MNALSSPARAGDVIIETEAPSSAVSWPAIFAGGFVAASVSITLMVLGSGLGFAAVSPWEYHGMSAVGFTISAAIWLIIVQWVASGLGGYITGRFRLRWLNTHPDEVFFRDTAHGLLTWAFATILVAAVVMSAGSAAMKAGTEAAATVASAAVSNDDDTSSSSATDPLAYYVDGLYRTSQPAVTDNTAMKTEATRIFVMGIKNDSFSDADKAYLAQSIIARTGATQADATARVNDAIARAEADKAAAKAAADKARKAASAFAFFTAFSMIIGAFIACVSAALGGRLRDRV